MPTRDTAWPAGTPCWIDYGAADLGAAKAFYADLLGWSYSGSEAEFGGYLTAEKNGLAAAGMAPQMDPGDPPRWTTYFATDDADATAARISAAGGSVVVEPMDVGPMGRMAIALDPQGHPFGLWQAGQQPGVQIYNEPGALVWNDAAVEDPAAARDFYGSVFGFRFDELEGAGGYFTFATGEAPLGGLGGHQPGSPGGVEHLLRRRLDGRHRRGRREVRRQGDPERTGHPLRSPRRPRGPVGCGVCGDAGRRRLTGVYRVSWSMAWAARKYLFLPRSLTVRIRNAVRSASASCSVTPASALTGAARISVRDASA